MNYAIPRIIEDLKARISKTDVATYMYGMPQDIGDTLGGMIIVAPVSTIVTPMATGVVDKDEDTIEVILVKNYKTSIYQNASQSGDVEFLTRIMRGRDESNNLLTNSIVYIIRSNFKRYGINQPSMSIDWNENRFAKEGLVAATLTIKQNSLSDQIIN